MTDPATQSPPLELVQQLRRLVRSLRLPRQTFLNASQLLALSAHSQASWEALALLALLRISQSYLTTTQHKSLRSSIYKVINLQQLESAERVLQRFDRTTFASCLLLERVASLATCWQSKQTLLSVCLTLLQAFFLGWQGESSLQNELLVQTVLAMAQRKVLSPTQIAVGQSICRGLSSTQMQ